MDGIYHAHGTEAAALQAVIDDNEDELERLMGRMQADELSMLAIHARQLGAACDAEVRWRRSS